MPQCSRSRRNATLSLCERSQCEVTQSMRFPFMRYAAVGVFSTAAAVIVGCGGGGGGGGDTTTPPTTKPTASATATASPTNTPTATASPTNHPTPTASPTPTPTNHPTPTASPTQTPMPTPTPTPVASPNSLAFDLSSPSPQNVSVSEIGYAGVFTASIVNCDDTQPAPTPTPPGNVVVQSPSPTSTSPSSAGAPVSFAITPGQDTGTCQLTIKDSHNNTATVNISVTGTAINIFDKARK
jgi:hypothetical protein